MAHWKSVVSPLVAAVVLGGLTGEAAAAPAFTAFESGQVRPLALAPNGKRLFAVNTPDNRLEIFDVNHDNFDHVASVPVGLEPVAVAVRNMHEVWVVNHLSDSVSVVTLQGPKATVTRTLLVGDEPRDIVFAGPGKTRAFITTAHRGQNAPFDPQNTTPSVGRADVWVFDVNNLGAGLGGTPETIINLFSDVPRALAVTPDGSKVYAAAFNSGNQTAIVPFTQIPDVGESAGGPPLPNVNHAGVPEPDIGLIVRFDGEHWVDETGRQWDAHIRFNLPDKDVFVIDATASTPALLPGASGFITGVGTTLFNMIVNPQNGKVYVTNTDARNHVRFSGEALFAETTVRGHLVDNRITVLAGGQAHPRDLNKHIDREACCAPVPNDETELSVSQPLGMAITPDGETLYVAVLGNDKVVVYDTDELESDAHFPDIADQIPVSGGGPTGVVLDPARDRLFVMTRFDNGISIVDTDTREEIAHVTMHNPEPASIVAGRRFLYDAALTSSHGDQSCASCHIFGDKDDLSWDLGDPDGDVIPPPSNLRTGLVPGQFDLHPMKGPMSTQSLRGLANHGPMHWRADRNGDADGPSVQPDGGAFSEEAAFKAFNVAFVGLVGRDEPLSAGQMQAFTDFQLQVIYPPNPIRALDNSLTADQQEGLDMFSNRVMFALGPEFEQHTCRSCHVLDPNGNAEYGVAFPGFFGTDGQVVAGEFSQTFKIPHLRNLYTKIGAFGMAEDLIYNRPDLPHYDVDPKGDQIRGFGFHHDGGKDTPMRFFNVFAVANGFAPDGFLTYEEQRKVAEFIFAFDSNLKPIVGQQVTLTTSNGAVAGPRIDLLKARAEAGDCELIVKAAFFGVELGATYIGGDQFTTSVSLAPPLSDAQIRQFVQVTHKPATYTCVPPGSGFRLGVDRDGDGYRDGDELLLHSDPADPNDTP